MIVKVVRTKDISTISQHMDRTVPTRSGEDHRIVRELVYHIVFGGAPATVLFSLYEIFSFLWLFFYYWCFSIVDAGIFSIC